MTESFMYLTSESATLDNVSQTGLQYKICMSREITESVGAEEHCLVSSQITQSLEKICKRISENEGRGELKRLYHAQPWDPEMRLARQTIGDQLWARKRWFA
jgi:hypothetical protein